MAKYNWTIDTLIQRLNLIQKLIPLETDTNKLYLLQRDYQVIQDYIEEYYDYETEDQMKLLENYNYIKDNFQTVDYLWEHYLKFANTVKKPIILPELKRNSLTNDDLLSITHDFYKSLNKYFFGNFMKNFSKRKDHIVYKRYNNKQFLGETITLHQ